MLDHRNLHLVSFLPHPSHRLRILSRSFGNPFKSTPKNTDFLKPYVLQKRCTLR
ncbi:hypothetical protein BDZ97DRAFT_1825512 [Flammula alnicola]|nr:hypothetical protein BDZ97DRAFT_1825512 [Flammula alnicola]